jgi:hypothetical protein
MIRKKIKDEQITSENIHKHRKAILKNGRKFKFPVQYLQHRVIINTVIIGLTVVIMIAGVSWWQLYHMHNSGDAIYGITRILPINVARISGHPVRFSDYLALFRSSVSVIEQQEGELPNTEETAKRLAGLRCEAMNTALANGLAMGMAREMGIVVTDEEIADYLVEQRNITGAEVSEASFSRIIRDNYNLSLTEYKRLFIELPLIRSRVAIAVDHIAQETLQEITRLRGEGRTLREISEELGDRVLLQDSGEGEVSILNLDGGRAMTAYSMEAGEVSNPFLSRAGNAYFVVQTLTKSSGRVSWESLTIHLTIFEHMFDQIMNEGRFEEFVTIDREGPVCNI